MTKEEAYSELKIAFHECSITRDTVLLTEIAEGIINKIFDEIPKPIAEFEAVTYCVVGDEDESNRAIQEGAKSRGYIEAKPGTFKRGKRYHIKIYEEE